MASDVITVQSRSLKLTIADISQLARG